MLISYLITVFNKETSIEGTIQSIQNQEGLQNIEFEIICYDDFSSDNSVKKIKALQKDDSRIKIFSNERNIGPSKSINKAAQDALGEFLIPIDGDDYIPVDFTKTILKMQEKHNADLLFGKSKRVSNFPKKIIHLNDEKFFQNLKGFEFCVQKKICHMGFLVKKKLWHESGGADEKVFIQDQSLPLRLALKSKSMVYLESYIYFLESRSHLSLSQNTNQQHHDRFFTCINLLETNKLSLFAKKGLEAQLISSMWKYQRDNHSYRALFSSIFIIYIFNKLFGCSPKSADIENWTLFFKNLTDVRKMYG